MFGSALRCAIVRVGEGIQAQWVLRFPWKNTQLAWLEKKDMSNIRQIEASNTTLEFDMNTIETGPSDNARDSEMRSRSWTHFRVDRRSARYCHVTFDHPPINTITETTVAELRDLAGHIEQDADLNVVVFDSVHRQ